jgi:glycosyltransferase involved in cell wall biosynthesis
LISVIIPAYNAGPFIGDAIRSVLEQPIGVDLIVVDDGSTDGTSDEVARFGGHARLIRCGQNKGVPSALNLGVANARGDIMGFLDADDTWSPGRLGGEVRLLSNRPDIAALWGRTCIVFLSGAGRNGLPSADWPPAFFPALGSMLIRRRVVERLGRFDSTLRHAHDFDFLARLKEARVPFHRHEDIVLTWRRHAMNMTNDMKLDRDYLATAIRHALRRRRSVHE